MPKWAMLKIHGLKNCDTCRAALKWAAAAGIDHQFIDFRKDGLDPASLEKWISAVGWETLLNRRGTTWRQLPEAEKESADEKSAAQLMKKHVALIKRPVFVTGHTVVVGFKAAERAALEELAAT